VTTVMREDPLPKVKSFEIPKKLIWEAWKCVAANKGAPGVDKENIHAYQSNLRDNLFVLWNRMSSGSYHPKAVRQVLIPKEDGTNRPLGIPTVTDRIAQTAVKLLLEPRMEELFHDSSFGYRPGKGAIDAVRKAREHCWKIDWVVDLDIRGFFDSIDHELMMRAVEKHVPESWVKLYIRRWLTNEIVLEDGQTVTCLMGTPQGAVISPLLANLYLHYAFDAWMQRQYPNIPFERYADDIVCHCQSEQQAKSLLVQLDERLKQCKLELHPKKTQIVYCKDGKRRKVFSTTRFDFLGFSFHARTTQDRQGNLFTGFNPGVSRKALKRMNLKIKDLNFTRNTQLTLKEIALQLNPMIRGWIAYYGHFYPEPLKRFLVRIELRLGSWARNKYKRLRRHKRRSWNWLKQYRASYPNLFVHWGYLFSNVRG